MPDPAPVACTAGLDLAAPGASPPADPAAAAAAPPAVQAAEPSPPAAPRHRRRSICGSHHEEFNVTILDDLMRASLAPRAESAEALDRRMTAAAVGVAAFAPRDAVEGMMAAQAVALHHAVLECLARAILPEQDAAVADRLRRQAANLSRTMVEMADAIERRRGGGARQVVRVERVVVQDGGQAIVGAVAPAAAAPVAGPPPAPEAGRRREAWRPADE